MFKTKKNSESDLLSKLLAPEKIFLKNEKRNNPNFKSIGITPAESKGDLIEGINQNFIL